MKKFACFGGRRSSHSDSEDDDTDDERIDGYCPLEDAGEPVGETPVHEAHPDEAEDGGYFRSPDSYQYHKSATESRVAENTNLQDGGYTDVDVKGKRLRKKLKRREIKKRSRHILHSTWKWIRRGFSTLLPSLTGMFIIYPAGTFVTAAAREQAAREARRQNAHHVGM